MYYCDKLVCAVIAFLVLCNSIRCQNECTYSWNVTTGQHLNITNPSFPNYYTPGSDCTWEVTTSQGQRVKMACDNVYMPPTQPDGSCKDHLAITTTGNLRDSVAFCVPFTARGSSLKFQLISSRSSRGGIFSCDITAEEIPAAGPTEHCEWSWSKVVEFFGGAGAIFHEFPSMVEVTRYINETNYNLCGGTIIARRVVLTAAHCVDPEPRNNGLIVGEHLITKNDEANRAKHLKISRVIVHPNASVSQGYHDIALLVTAEEMQYSSRVGPACLPFNIKKEDLLGKYVTATGWGSTQENGFSTNKLQKVKLPIVPDSKCASVYEKNYFSSEYHLCIYETGKSTCEGDAGGPLYYYEDKNSCHTVVGIVNDGSGCGKTKPTVNVDVHYHLPWILDQLPDVELCNK